jgi:hypothetical protein
VVPGAAVAAVAARQVTPSGSRNWRRTSQITYPELIQPGECSRSTRG